MLFHKNVFVKSFTQHPDNIITIILFNNYNNNNY